MRILLVILVAFFCSSCEVVQNTNSTRYQNKNLTRFSNRRIVSVGVHRPVPPRKWGYLRHPAVKKETRKRVIQNNR